ncbi:hypothetical protein M7I_0508 [Glarea lozoyensis 74030]|uniref:CBF1-interacting co-repressor CIR N-terminal domain-containing protein n=1 Tax=Glarea lozoyensis (strain ATCC 74030 / MF5533) TaxID=1104152 RepID=H0EDQ3_GLAL7|nr:hypothetical protein M7I_0508 [Glarea lozoyensis 74030]
MPLHLLGKKSWNVYNTANIEVVKRDEAIAAAEEAASEQRMQELDSLRRMQILRGEEPTPLPIEDSPKLDSSKHPRERGEGTGRERKKRKRAGENDTDFEMRIAHDMTNTENRERQLVLRKDTDAPLVNRRGHIDLFPQPKPSSHKTVQKNEEAERELAKKKKEYEDQYTLKFFNAAGFKSSLGSDPWYKKTNSTDVGEEMPGKDVWGNEDPRRKEREAKRIVSNDPLAMMKAGARQVRQVEQERKQWREEKDREMRALEEQERERRHRKRKRREADSEDDLEGFSLDNHGGSSSKKHRSEILILNQQHNIPNFAVRSFKTNPTQTHHASILTGKIASANFPNSAHPFSLPNPLKLPTIFSYNPNATPSLRSE